MPVAGILAAATIGFSGTAAAGIDVSMMKQTAPTAATYPAQSSIQKSDYNAIVEMIQGANRNLLVCGDSEPDPGETCDDGNTTPGDGCSATCQVEAGSDCTAAIAGIFDDNAVENGSFSNTSSAPWTQSGTPFSPICQPPFGCGAGTALSSDPEGGWYWAGGSPSDSTTNATQVVTIPTNATTLTFEVWEAFCPGDLEDDFVSVSIDGNEVFNSGTCDSTAGYELQTVDLATATGGPYNDGGVHTISIDGFMDFDVGDPQTGSVFVDLVAINFPLVDPIPPVPSSCLVGVCGDGVASSGEACDDGNTTPGDGCSATCTIEEDDFFCTDAEAALDVIGGSLGSDDDVVDGGIEAGPGGAWTETGTQFEPICSEFFCGAALAADGEFFAWFGGSSMPNAQTLTQDVTISTSATDLTFDLLIGICDSAADSLTVEIDGNVEYTNACVADTEGYEQVSVDVSAYADGGTHTVSFIGNTVAANGGNSNYFVDNIAISYAVTPDRAPDASFCGALDEACTTVEKFEGAFPPAGWTTWNLSSDVNGAEWGTSGDGFCGSANWAGGNTTGGSGQSACIDSDAPNQANTTRGYLCTPELDLSTVSDPIISFAGNYQTAFYDDDDDPNTPTPEFFRIVTGTVAPNNLTLDTAYVDGPILIDHLTGDLELSGPAVYSGALTDIEGEPSAYVCFHYGGEFSWYAQVDNVALRGSSCDTAPTDTDGDGVFDSSDNCITKANPSQTDTNGDGYGNACDMDLNNDCVVNIGDLAILKSVFFPNPAIPDADANGDGSVNFFELALLKETFFTSPTPGPGPSATPTCP